MRLAEANRVRRERARRLAEIRYAPSMAESMERCAAIIETRPACVQSMDVHELLEVCVGVGPEGADALQQAASMFRAYTVAELPATKAAALVALLRLARPAWGTRVGSSCALVRQRQGTTSDGRVA